jgi:hypothetical protein
MLCLYSQYRVRVLTTSDLWSFDLDTLAWTQHTPALSPSPRSGCVFAPDHESGTAVLYGGFCSQPAAGRGDIEKSVTLADQWYAFSFFFFSFSFLFWIPWNSF